MADPVAFEENVYYDQTEAPDVFQVTIAANPGAEKCKLSGDYEFHISTENFALVDKGKNKRVFTWPFRYVRRYGKSSTNFQFEAGRKCQSGEGLFSLKTKPGDSEAIFDLVQMRFTSMKQRDKQYRNGSVDDSPTTPNKRDSQPGPTPTLPARGYDKYENSEAVAGSLGKPVSQSQHTDTRKSIKPPKAPKPKSIRKPQNPSSNEGNPSVNASQINQLIEQNKDDFSHMEPDNTYSSIGAAGNAEFSSNTAQYSAVYTQKAPPNYSENDDMYSEVKM